MDMALNTNQSILHDYYLCQVLSVGTNIFDCDFDLCLHFENEKVLKLLYFI